MFMRAIEDRGPAKVERSITILPTTRAFARASQTFIPLTPAL